MVAPQMVQVLEWKPKAPASKREQKKLNNALNDASGARKLQHK